jgi:glycosyltransferase involved in cell wall biosynthesis
MNDPVLTVAMSVYNGAPHLRDAIQSILAQTEPNFEFLIVDDGSTDQTPQILAESARHDSRIRIITQPNRGLIAALNRLVTESRAPLIARMDADDISLPNRFARQKAFLDCYPDYGVVGSSTFDLHPGQTPKPSSGTSLPTCHEDFLAAIEQDTPLLCHSTVMRRSLLIDVGGYRAPFRHCEDYDLWLRLAEVTRLCSLPDRLLIYRYSNTQVSSRHIVEQIVNAAAARFAYDARQMGRPDPFADGQDIPPLSSFDIFFDRPGAKEAARQRIATKLIHSPVALRGPGFDVILDYARHVGASSVLWRTVVRLIRIGEFRRATQLAAALCGACPS